MLGDIIYNEMPLTLRQGLALFNQIADQENLCWDVEWEGCASRTLIVCHQMREAKLRPTLALARKEDKIIRTQLANGKQTSWNFHATTVLPLIGDDGMPEYFVFDPMLFDGPATTAEWGNIMQLEPYDVHVTDTIIIAHKVKMDVNNIRPEEVIDAKKDLLDLTFPILGAMRTVFASVARMGIFQEQRIPENFRGKTWRTEFSALAYG